MTGITCREFAAPIAFAFMGDAKKRIVILLVAAAAYAVDFWPSTMLRTAVLNAYGNPPYEGVWIFIPHVFLYTTLCALVCALAWIVLANMKWLPPIPLGRGRGTIFWGVAGALIVIAAMLAFIACTHMGKIGYVPPKSWSIAGNLFSNFYEEFIYRGFLLTALAAVFGFWPGAILSSAIFGLSHPQYPLELQAAIATLSIPWAWIRRRTGTLWAPWISHMLMDVVLDSLIA